MTKTHYEATCPECGETTEVWIPAKNYTFGEMAGTSSEEVNEWLDENQKEVVRGEGASAVKYKTYQPERTLCDSCSNYVYYVARCTDY